MPYGDDLVGDPAVSTRGTPGFVVVGPVSGLRSSSWAMQCCSDVNSPPACRQHFRSSRRCCDQPQPLVTALTSTARSHSASLSMSNVLASADATAALPSPPNSAAAARRVAAMPARLVEVVDLCVLVEGMKELCC